MPDYSSVMKSINARDDSLFTGPTGKAMFSHSKNHKRCILLAEGFYEWRRRGKDRTPFYTKRRDGQLMLMAAIYDVAQIQGSEEPLYTYATITTNASSQLDWLHDRMPVLIPNHDHEKIRMWLDPDQPWNAKLEAMLKPCDEFMDVSETTEGVESEVKSLYALETYQVDEKVNSVRNDSPDFTKPWISSSNKKTLNRFFVSKAAPAVFVSSSNPDTKKDVQQQVDDKEETEQDRGQVGFDDQDEDGPWNETEQQGTNEEGPEERVLKYALEISRKEQDEHGHSIAKTDSEHCESPSSDSPATEGGRKMHGGLSGSVDLRDKRRKEMEQEEEDLKNVLELSRLQALADGHKDVDAEDSTPIPQGGEKEELTKKEQEELKLAIAASLSDAKGTSKTLVTESPVHPPTSPRRKPTTSAQSTRKRKLDPSVAASNAGASKKGSASRDGKITNFFQPKSSS
ncbi:MAG: hypothetical protein J3Q66DRAFT_145400 [Benniella sp.]|nr:MAG: hypothetical protein J3Q66DRAFT_145400 [Benniella sp.]